VSGLAVEGLRCSPQSSGQKSRCALVTERTRATAAAPEPWSARRALERPRRWNRLAGGFCWRPGWRWSAYSDFRDKSASENQEQGCRAERQSARLRHDRDAKLADSEPIGRTVRR